MYELKDLALNFSGEQQYLHRNIVLKTDLIKNLKESDKSNYVLPVQLVSATDSVNAEKSLLILRPSVETPEVQYELSSAILNISDKNSTYELFKIAFESLLGFQCYGRGYTFCSSIGIYTSTLEDYTIENNGKIEFKKVTD